MTANLARSVAAEATGTALLVAAVIGSGIMAQSLAGGNVALALLANTLSTGCILVVLILMLGPVSGAHFNPAVSVVFAMRKELDLSRLAAYIVAQIAGAVAGAVLAHAMFEQPPFQLSTHARTGAAQWLSEIVATFGLVGTILGVSRVGLAATASAVGLYISAAYWFTSSTSFANPAVTIARSLTDTFAGIGPAGVPWFVGAQLVGAALGAAYFGWLLGAAPLRSVSVRAGERPKDQAQPID